MFAVRLDGPEGSETIMNPTWEQIEAAIRALDGIQKTLVTIAAEDCEAHMGIGGGSGAFICYATRDNLTFDTLVNPSGHADRKQRVIAGGQPGDYTEKHCVTLPAILRAAKAFAILGELDGSLEWDER